MDRTKYLIKAKRRFLMWGYFFQSGDYVRHSSSIKSSGSSPVRSARLAHLFSKDDLPYWAAMKAISLIRVYQRPGRLIGITK